MKTANMEVCICKDCHAETHIVFDGSSLGALYLLNQLNS